VTTTPPIRRALTIDGPTSKDLDDALWIEPEGPGWRVTVYVADVAAAVPIDSAEDKAARIQAETIYGPGFNRPMLPPELSEDFLSLLPGKTRWALAVEVCLGPDFDLSELHRARVFFATIQSSKRLSYADVPALIADPSSGVGEVLRCASHVTRNLLAARRREGALALYDLHSGWYTNEDGLLQKVKAREDTVGHLIVQEFMVLANRALAVWAIENDLPVLYRNHTASAAAPDRAEMLAAIDAVLIAPGSSLDLSLLQAKTNLLLNRAKYDPILRGHWGLSVAAYLHGTSPIRRYADLVTHRQIRACLLGEPPPYDHAALATIAAELNETLLAHRKASSESFKARDEKLAVRAEARGELADAPEHLFEKAFHASLTDPNGPSPAVADAARRRLADGRMPLVSLVRLLGVRGLPGGWKWVKVAALEALGRKPETARSLLANAPNILKGFPEVRFEVAPRTGPYTGFEVVAVLEDPGQDPLVSLPQVATQKQRAIQRACVALLAGLHGLPVPPFDPDEDSAAGPLPAASKSPEPVPLPDPEDLNPVSALNEWCQKKGLQVPSYPTKRAGSHKNPYFVAECVVGAARVEGRAANTKGARQAAARAMVLRLHKESTPGA